ncbi:MAG: tyrosine-protein phosphatase [Ramlibacter sp.]|nr:tyrosine-protein phosphatase [Ramlibacter sp.]
MIELPHAPNFRDIGGYAASGGLRVRRGRLFRSDHLAALTDDEFAALTLDAPRVCDLRGVAERAAAPCALRNATVHSLPIEPTIVQKLNELIAAGGRLSPADVVALMQETYRGFVHGSTHRFAQLFGHLLDAEEPVVFHCTAGKDRTGFAAALVLRSLGVSAGDVMRDYLLTNERLQPRAEAHRVLAPEVVSILRRVQPEFLDAAFDAVDRGYGGLEGYFREGLALGDAQRKRLRELYLESGRG